MGAVNLPAGLSELLGPARNGLCGARTRDGSLCTNHVGPFATRCRFHGGATPLAKTKIDELMAASRDWAVRLLHQFLVSHPPCEHCGRVDEPHLMLKAIQMVLDRTGVTAGIQIEQKGPPAGELAELSDEELAALAERLAADARALASHI